MDDNEQRQAPEEFEREFFGPNQTGELGTADLDRMAESQATRILKPLVFALMLGLSGLAAWQYVGHLRYFFAPTALAPLGATEDIGVAIRAEQPDPNLRSHRYVSLSGIPQRYASAGDKGVFKLIGAQIYVARDTAKLPAAKAETFGDADNPDENREEFDGSGWLIAFSDLPRKYAGIRDFYAENYRVPFCSHDPSPRLAAYLEAERERTGKRDCVEGYLLIEGEAPRDQWPYLAGLSLYALLVAGATVRALRSLRPSRH